MNKIQMGKKYKTRDGCDVEILKVDLNDRYSVVGIMKRKDRDAVGIWDKFGNCMPIGKCEYDLVEWVEPTKIELYVYQDGNGKKFVAFESQGQNFPMKFVKTITVEV